MKKLIFILLIFSFIYAFSETIKIKTEQDWNIYHNEWNTHHILTQTFNEQDSLTIEIKETYDEDILLTKTKRTLIYENNCLVEELFQNCSFNTCWLPHKKNNYTYEDNELKSKLEQVYDFNYNVWDTLQYIIFNWENDTLYTIQYLEWDDELNNWQFNYNDYFIYDEYGRLIKNKIGESYNYYDYNDDNRLYREYTMAFIENDYDTMDCTLYFYDSNYLVKRELYYRNPDVDLKLYERYEYLYDNDVLTEYTLKTYPYIEPNPDDYHFYKFHFYYENNNNIAIIQSQYDWNLELWKEKIKEQFNYNGETLIEYIKQEKISNYYWLNKERIMFQIQLLSTETNNHIINDEIYTYSFPNPFNSIVNISFDIKETSPVTLEIYNIRGQKIKTLIQEELKPNSYNFIWDATNNSGNTISSGIYFYKLKTNNNEIHKKINYLK